MNRERVGGFLSSRGYRAAKTRLPSVRSLIDAVLIGEIATIFEANYRVCGVRKMWHALKRSGWSVGRAEVTVWQLSDSYIGINSEVPVKKIWFFEIHSDHRRQHYGREFARQLVRHDTAWPLITFSEDADKFWAGIGWHYYPRKDGDSIHYRKLFISQKIGK